jgi:membrane-associated phospholipid phosphatase
MLAHKTKTIFLFLFCAFSVCFSVAQNLDINILKSINQHRNKLLDNSFKLISSSVTPISVATPLALYACSRYKKDSSLQSKAIIIGESILFSAIVSTSLKHIVNRPRPFTKYPFIEKLSSAGSPSFPSGHTSDAFATATSLSLAFPKWYVVTPAYLWAGAVGYSRMHLGVHYPSDVLAGAIVGAGAAYLSQVLNKKIFKQNKF